MGCYLQERAKACEDAVRPRAHLSRAQASEYDLDGPASRELSRCITVPDKATAQQVYHPDRFVAGVGGEPHYDCVR